MQFREWEALSRTEDDSKVIDFLKYGFAIGTRARYLLYHPWDVTTYIMIELEIWAGLCHM